MAELYGKVAIVTGGASGIGRATCELFVREGAKVVIADVDERQAESVVAQLRSSGRDDVLFVRTDVGDRRQVAAAGGVAFDSSAVENENRTVTFPMGQAWRFGLGAQYQLNQSVNVGAACTYGWGGDMAVDQQSTLPVALGGRGNVSGQYNDTWYTFANLNLTWKF